MFIPTNISIEFEEITDELLSNQVYQDRPDIVARVFKMKLDALLKDLTKKHV